MERRSFEHEGLTLSFLDSGTEGQLLIALHAHWMEGTTFAPLAAALAPGWRIVAMDQRGHGHSDHAATYTRNDYLGDLAALFAYLRPTSPAVLLGHSLGGINAYQFAARHPEMVRGLIIEDIGTEVSADVSFTRAWQGVFASREALLERIGPRLAPYLEDSLRETSQGWRLAFDPQEMESSTQESNGDHWSDWLATTCPALLFRGSESRLTTQSQFDQMALRRPNTILRVLHCGHAVHVDQPDTFHEIVREFLLQFDNPTQSQPPSPVG
ncbi:MAG: alpha/beta hydrolase [Planctomycetota bacterium]